MLPVAIAAPVVFYVAAEGDDARGDGSAAKPWATISVAVRKAPEDGGTVIVRPGVYPGMVRISRRFKKPLVVQSEKAYRAQLRNDRAVLLITDASNVEMRGFEMLRTPPSGKPEALLAHVARAESIVLHDNIIHDSYNNDLLKINEDVHDFLISGNVFYNQEGLAGQHIDINGCRNVFITGNIFFNDFEGTGVAGEKTHGFIVIKNSGEAPSSRRTLLAGNIFLNFQGSAGSNMILLGEDGKPFHETQEVLIENNLLIGNSPVRLRSPFGAKGVRDVMFRSNTITGPLPSTSFAARLNREGRNAVNQNIQFASNVWSNPRGTMAAFSDGQAAESTNVTVDNNAYWNGGRPLPRDSSAVQPPSDKRADLADPKLPWSEVTVPRWQGNQFRSGSGSIREEFRKLVQQFGMPGSGSSLLGRADPALASADDIRGAARGSKPDIGAVQHGVEPLPVRLMLLPARVMGGVETTVNRVVLQEPAPAGGLSIQLSSSNASIASVPAMVQISEGSDSISFAIKTSSVEADTPVTFTAVSNKGKIQAKLLVVPQGVVSVNPRSYSLPTGDTDHYVMLEGPASEGLKVTMTSSRPELITYPRIEVPAGKSWASFTVRSAPVQAETPVKLIAGIGSARREETVTFRPGQAITSVRLSVTHSFNGAPITGTVLVSEPAAPGREVVVNLRSEFPDIGVVPPSVRVPDGQTSVSFPVQAKPVKGRRSVAIQASINGTSKSNYVVIGVTEPIGIGLYPGRNNKASGLVRLSAPAPPGFRCMLASSRPELADVPKSLSTEEGSSRIPFEVQLRPGSESAEWTISATCGGTTVTGSLQKR